MTQRPFINLAVDSSPITDADEEIFLLYSALNQAKTALVGPDGLHRGLGHVDSRKDVLTVRLELQRPSLSPPSAAANPSCISSSANSQEKSVKPRVKRNARKRTLDAASVPRVVEVEIVQDPTALRSRIGDTGSVVWRASTELAKVFLQQHFFPPTDESPVFDRDRLGESHCLELGAGTGLLGLALAPLFCTYTMTDIPPLLPLLRKNVSLNAQIPGAGTCTRGSSSRASNIVVEELDWLVLASLPPGSPTWTRYCPVPPFISTPTNPILRSGTEPDRNHDHCAARAWDLILAVDCIYNPSLLPGLVETIDALSTPGRTWVLVVAELRQEDVLREFLSLWLERRGLSRNGGSGGGGAEDGLWRITRIEGLLDVHFVVWAGRKM